MCTVWALHVVVINCGMYPVLLTCIKKRASGYYNHSYVSIVVALKAKRRAKYLKTRDDVLDSARAELQSRA